MKIETVTRKAAPCLFALFVLFFPCLAPCQEPVEAPAEGIPPVSPRQAPGRIAVSNDIESAYDSMELLTEVMLHVKKYYVEEKSYKEITYAALHGMLQALDPHSNFMEPEVYSEMQEDTSGKFSGIGIHIGVKDGLLTVIAPIEDTPAFKAGLLAGDRIVEINGEKTLNMPLREAVKRLKGPKGTKVKVLIGRAGLESPKEVEMIRDDIEVPSVKGTRILRHGIGYIRITQFTATTGASLQQALDTLITNKMDALVLDLRSNPGGLLKSGIEVAEKFLKRNQLIVTTKGREGVQNPIENKAGGNIHYTDFRMAVLVDGGSASASEIVAGALQDHKRAVLIGSTTFGKGSVQSVIQLKPEAKTEAKGAIRLTTARYYTPSGRPIKDNAGLEPDIPVVITPDEWRKVQARRAQLENPTLYSDEEKKPYADVVDRQIERAIDLLQGLKAFK